MNEQEAQQQEALDILWEQSGYPEIFAWLKVIVFILAAFFLIRYFVRRANHKTRLQEETLAELRKLNKKTESQEKPPQTP